MGDRLSRLLARNWTLKVSAFALALLLWTSVRVEAPNAQVLREVPIRVDLADPGWALSGEPDPIIASVRLWGPSRELIRIAGERPSIVIPLDQVLAADTTVVLRDAWVRIQDRRGVRVDDIEPATVRLSFEPLERVALPVAVRTEGELAEGLALAAQPVASPTELRVVGPRARLRTLDAVPLVALDLATIRSSGPVEIRVDTAEVGGLQVVPLSVELDVRVEDRVERLVSGVRVMLPEDVDVADLELLPRNASVRLSGARSLLERMDPTLLRIVVVLPDDGLPGQGESVAARLRVEGLPPLVNGVAEPDEAVIRRPEPEPEPGATDGRPPVPDGLPGPPTQDGRGEPDPAVGPRA